MKIIRIDVFRANLPLKYPFRLDSPVPIVSVAADTDLEAVRVGLEKESIMVSRVPPGGYSDAPDHETLRIATFSTHAPDQIDRLVGVMGRLL